MHKCSKCGEKILRDEKFAQGRGKNGEPLYCCDNCYNKNKPNHPSKNIKKIKSEIYKLEQTSVVVIVLCILGFFGLFIFLVPGILLFIAAAVIYSSRRSRAATLSAHLETLTQNSRKEKTSDEDPIKHLKKRFANGKITEKEYKNKLKVLKDS